MTIKWSFSYNSFVKYPFIMQFIYKIIHSYDPQTTNYKVGMHCLSSLQKPLGIVIQCLSYKLICRKHPYNSHILFLEVSSIF